MFTGYDLIDILEASHMLAHRGLSALAEWSLERNPP